MSRLFEPRMAANSPPRSDGLSHSLSSNIAKKKRGGRQLRQVVLSPDLKFSIRQFAGEVGTPKLMEPTGFRDFRGWLERVAGTLARGSWSKLVHAMMEETAGDRFRIMFIKEEVVRDIVRAIVVPKPGESAKLVSTNCGRQCARPRSGNTLMTILERVLVEKGIVSETDIEMFMRDRAAAPHTYMYRDLHHQQQHAVRASVQSAPYSSGHRSMSVEAITSAPEPRVSQAFRYPFPPPPHRASLAPPYRANPELGYRSGPSASARSLPPIHFRAGEGLSTLPGSAEVSSTSTQLGYSASSPPSSRFHFSGVGTSGSPLHAPLPPSAATNQERLPSFRELEDSLEQERNS